MIYTTKPQKAAVICLLMFFTSLPLATIAQDNAADDAGEISHLNELLKLAQSENSNLHTQLTQAQTDAAATKYEVDQCIGNTAQALSDAGEAAKASQAKIDTLTKELEEARQEIADKEAAQHEARKNNSEHNDSAQFDELVAKISSLQSHNAELLQELTKEQTTNQWLLQRSTSAEHQLTETVTALRSAEEQIKHLQHDLEIVSEVANEEREKVHQWEEKYTWLQQHHVASWLPHWVDEHIGFVYNSFAPSAVGTLKSSLLTTTAAVQGSVGSVASKVIDVGYSVPGVPAALTAVKQQVATVFDELEGLVVKLLSASGVDAARGLTVKPTSSYLTAVLIVAPLVLLFMPLLAKRVSANTPKQQPSEAASEPGSSRKTTRTSTRAGSVVTKTPSRKSRKISEGEDTLNVP